MNVIKIKSKKTNSTMINISVINKILISIIPDYIISIYLLIKLF